MIQQHLTLLHFIQAAIHLSAEEKAMLTKVLKEADKALTISEFKLERTEKVKRTTAILLEETIEELEQKQKSITESNLALTKSLDELKAAQAQLIQAEKMASLGELTAGIAHEIQNPLNFVNNFSDVSKELLEEMLEKLKNGDMEEVNAIANDVIQNLEKILHHGKRADGIVKGMLQHSRTNKGEKEKTDINILVDEYLRLAYHGLRAKDKSFNATLETAYDDSIGRIKIIPQDIGRVVLNLITNAFYAVNEKKKDPLTSQSEFGTGSEGGINYVPTVKVKTKRVDTPLGVGGERKGKCVEVSVKDNGNGIPKQVLDKIYQPFFTTKPTGQGTGLGLSLSYDIVKAHGGDLQVSTEENKGTEFIISIPITR